MLETVRFLTRIHRWTAHCGPGCRDPWPARWLTRPCVDGDGLGDAVIGVQGLFTRIRTVVGHHARHAAARSRERR